MNSLMGLRLDERSGKLFFHSKSGFGESSKVG